MSSIPVVIPYLASGAQGRELEYAVAGWRRHAKFPILIVIVGDYHPVVETGRDIIYIHCEQVPAPELTEWRCHLDHVHKFREVHKILRLESFIYACDDMYAVNNFTLEDVVTPKLLEDDMGGNPLDVNGWIRDMWKTRKLCLENGFGVKNWVCHLPVYYDWRFLESIYDKFDCDHRSYVVENIYYNMVEPLEPIRIDGTDEYKFGLYDQNYTAEDLDRAFREKVWITNSPDGWSPLLDRKLDEYYNGKI